MALFADLDAEIQKRSDDKQNLDRVARALIRDGKRVSTADLHEAVEQVLGGPSKVLQSTLLD